MVKSGHIFFLLFVIIYSASGGLGEYHFKEPVNVLPLNSSDDDFAPCWNFFEGSLYYNSNREGYSYFYKSGVNTDSSFTVPEKLPDAINKSGSNQSFITFESADKAYYSAFRLSSKRSYQNIFVSEKKKKVWTAGYPLKELVSDNFISHPTVSPDGTIMVFATNMESSGGDTDLWIAYKQDNNKWERIESISGLNSQGNEITPFLASADTLFFASDGLGGAGGYDIFYSVYADGRWNEPNPLTEINTPHNESDFTIIPGNRALFASDRPGGRGGLDIWESDFTQSETEIKRTSPEFDITIAATTTSIRMIYELEYKTYPVFPYIFADKYNEMFEIPEGFRPILIPPGPDSVLKYSLAVIISRMHDNPAAKIHIEVNMNADNSIKDDFRKKMNKYLSRISNIDTSRYNFTYASLDSDMIAEVSSDEPSLFAPLLLGRNKFRIIPGLVQATVYVRPEESFRKYTCGIYIDSAFSGLSVSGSEAGKPMIFDLNPIAPKLWYADNMTLRAQVKDTAGREIEKTLEFDISRSQVKYDDLTNYKGKKYISYYYIFPGLDNKGFVDRTNILTNRLADAVTDSKNVIIEYYSDIAKNEAGTIASYLSKYDGYEYNPSSNGKITIRKGDPAGLNKDLVPHLFHILILNE